MRWRGKVFIFIAVGVVVASLLVAWGIKEPRYQGRTLTSWLEQCANTIPEDPQQNRPLTEAQLAIRAIGAEKVLPYSMRMIRAKDGPMKRWIIDQSTKWEWFDFKIKKAQEHWDLGIAGFYGLGTNGAAAIPELTLLLNDTNHAAVAAWCLIFVGKPARTAVCQALTNANPEVRLNCALQLEKVMDDGESYLGQIKSCLTHPDSDVRSAAVGGIGLQTNYADVAIPLLLAALKDPDAQVASNAARVLRNFGTNAFRAFGALTNAARNGGTRTARAALGTLVQIAPSETLPIVLSHLRSDDPERRSQALGFLTKYPVDAPEIQPAIERATVDPDSMVSLKAKEFITKQQRALRGNQPLFPDEPTYGGKRLGEWLKIVMVWRERNENRALGKEGEVAIRQMGTNAIPALLQRLVYVEPPFGLPVPELNRQAEYGFDILGERAKGALPELATFLDGPSEDCAEGAMRCIDSICGRMPDGIPYLMQALTSRHVGVRTWAISLLWRGKNVEFKIQRKQAVPLLVKLLDDPEKRVQSMARDALKVIDPEVATKAGIVVDGKEGK
jgi:HEAT repeat protein